MSPGSGTQNQSEFLYSHMSLTKLKFFIFPPFSLVAKSSSKIIQEELSGIMISLGNHHNNDAVTCRLTNHSLSQQKSRIDTTTSLEQITSIVPQTTASSLRSSWEQWEAETFQRKLSTSAVPPGNTQQHLDMKLYLESGKTIAAKGMLIPLLQM